MESLRNQALQRELTRIEDEAREHSMTAIGIAAELEAAEQLCVLINAGLEAEDGVEPCVIYYGRGKTSVCIYPGIITPEFLQRADEAELEWVESVEPWGGATHKNLIFSGFGGVNVIVENNALAHYLAGLAIEQAAA